MKKFKKGILLALSTMVLGGAIIGVGSQTANSSEQLARIHRAVSSEVTTSETTSSSSESTSSGTEVQDAKKVQVGDELAGKTIWFNPFLLFNRVDYDDIPQSGGPLINFEITGTFKEYNIESVTSKTLNGNCLCLEGYRGYYPLSLPRSEVIIPGLESDNYYYHSIGKFDERFTNNYTGSCDYSIEIPNGIDYKKWYSITFYDEKTFKTAENEQGGYVGITDLSIKVKNFGDKFKGVFYYEIPTNVHLATYNQNISTIYKQKNAILSLDDIINKLEITGYKTLKVIRDEYSGNGNKPGNYEVVFEYTDDVETKRIPISVIVSKDDLPTAVWNFEYLYTDQSKHYNLTIDTNERLKIKRDDIISILSYCSDINNEMFSFTIDGNEDVKNMLVNEGIDKEGKYSIDVSIKSSNGSVGSLYNVTINVAGKDSGTIIDKRLTVWQKTCKFFSDVCNNIKNFFVWLYDHTIGAIVKFFQKKD